MDSRTDDGVVHGGAAGDGVFEAQSKVLMLVESTDVKSPRYSRVGACDQMHV